MSKIGTQKSALQQAVLAIRELRSELNSIKQAKVEPLAIVGMSCRFPGRLNTPSDYWDFLCERGDAVTEIPPERFAYEGLYDADAEALGKFSTQYGSYLEDVDQFDHHYFGISADEAAQMDPQQRIMLELTQEALDDASQPSSDLSNSNTGVFVGLSLSEYGWMSLPQADTINSYTATGSFGAMVANRISYAYNFNGPSYTVDAVCSSSLLAVHVACENLRNDACDIALAGGVGLGLTPAGLLWFSKLGVLTTQGQCRAFDANGGGIVLGEGAAMLVLKRLSKAQADGDSIYAVIRGSAVYQDGRSNGITAPSSQAQTKLLEAAYRNSGVDPSQVQFVECHGTGTKLGDPLEAQALGEVIGKIRPKNSPCYIGSVKTNLGHLQAVGGLASLVKTALAVKARKLPPSIHFDEPNPLIPFDELNLQVQTDLTAWPYPKETPRAGVTSLSFGGTNVHVVVEAAPEPVASAAAQVEAPERPYLLPLSARSTKALRATAKQFQTWLGESEPNLADLAYTTALRRNHYDHRLCAVGATASELADALAAHLRQDDVAALTTGHTDSVTRFKTIFLFSGQGGQWHKMGRDLYAQEALFRSSIDRTDAALRPLLGWSIRSRLLSNDEPTWLTEIDEVQPILFALQVAYAAVWQSWGIQPDAIVGHSMGEVAAAHIAGALSLEDAARVIYERSRLFKQVRGEHSAMALVRLTLTETKALLAEHSEHVAVAASNSQQTTVISGDANIISQLLESLREKNIFCRLIDTGGMAGHSPRVDPILPELRAALGDISAEATTVPMYSTVTGEKITGSDLDASYWCRNARESVLFAPVVQELISKGRTIFIEMSPHPTLLPAIAADNDEAAHAPVLLPSSKRDAEIAMYTSFGALHTHGVQVDWTLMQSSDAQITALPHYPWQRKRCWVENRVGTNLLGTQANSSLQNSLAVKANKEDDAAFDSPFLREFDATSVRLRVNMVTRFVQEITSNVMVLESAEILDPESGFFELGMNSLQAIEMRRHLERAIGQKLPSTVAFEQPNIALLAAYIVDRLADRNATESMNAETGQTNPVLEPAVAAEEIAATAIDDMSLEALFDQELAAIMNLAE